ncbi:MAG: EFR1 family ferrodoxin [Clostridiales bacterium]|jgi:ferredoxin/flavodoxin|nr:EFR1 family ferrodoxin [Clostridiales bacterium]
MNIIFYFSGTGNSLFAAREIAKVLGDTKIAPVADNFGADLGGFERIGFVYPIYFGGVPLVVKNFVESLDFSKCPNAYLFAIATRGGIPQNGLNEMNALLSAQSRELDYGTLLIMGANYILLYGRMFFTNAANRHAAKVLPKIAAAIRDKEKRPRALPKPGSMSMTERARGKVHEAARDYTVSGGCVSCSLCAKICPVCNIELKDGKPTFGEKCEQCMACLQFCPRRAINYKGKTEKRKRYRHPDVTAADLVRR